ncbi:putative non-specific serine/threonine protein kinase [Helianthus annuus]|uniref:Non-specific serine/threonine protein kinase n=1 Tax=Helianthus annuus TaxID=4232 RepID=A0A9K3IM58_HELAN|nr:putative non-specific serine/threonine protein kinase [Helianthus annuus]KAJ0563820.1 putative non-specific serine/threonine protein kinase [Helianthus annuus]KAJ0729158.1 putative non-specific serine/threonine protein kinase [Helianthus annuus]KAJ0731896.1 putative non-specific serine/threonine protein kinase [Helianthus annuus]KAJ0908761.1 putative non-specific serine/threonine protein kinase [Helianthus annuus]
MIPSSLNSLKGLVELDISHNNLSGQIPNFLELFELEYLNLPHNDFEGEVPTLGVFANESAFSIFGTVDFVWTCRTWVTQMQHDK